MELNKTYTSKRGVKRKPLSFSECGRFVLTEVTKTNGTVILEHLWTIILKERINSGLWDQKKINNIFLN